MAARLIALEGPLAGRVYEVGEAPLVLGRDPASTVLLDEPKVSRRHFSLAREEAGFRITDLQSKAGTLVNGARIDSRILGHGDRIQVERSLFVFEAVAVAGTHAAAGVDTGEIEVDDHALETAGDLGSLSLTDALWERRDGPLATERLARDLDALVRVSNAIGSLRATEPLANRLLELLFEVVPAERGGILLARPGSDELRSVLARGTGVDARRPLQVSRTIVRRVLAERAAVFTNEVVGSADLARAESLSALGVRSILCMPMAAPDSLTGLLYLDTSAEAGFDRDHLRLVTAIAGVAAVAFENARRLEALERENESLKEGADYDIRGESRPVRDLLRAIARVAPTDSTVLIRGESGSGKELVARAVHAGSPRATKPFVAFNCAALTESLLESEVFGHEKGAFTGAVAQKRGKLELAHEGTVFMDEIGELPLTLQAKLLRVLQEREFERVGGTRSVKVDIRLVAATNRDLEAAIREGRFRQDLFYRLNVVSLAVPPLRERRDDIPHLAEHFVRQFALRFKRPVEGFSPEAMKALVGYDWPGNVRELQNAIERAVVMGSGALVLPEDLPESLIEVESTTGQPAARYHEAVTEAKRQIVKQALDEAKGTITEAAKILGLNPTYLHRLLKNLDLKTGSRSG